MLALTMGRQVDADMISELLHEYVEQEEEAATDNTADSICNRSRPPLFGLLTKLTIYAPSYEDPRAYSYVLAHARRLKTLIIKQTLLNIDSAFTRQLIGAPLEQLEFHFTEITNVTIYVLCQQLAASLRSLTLHGCDLITQEGFISHNNDISSFAFLYNVVILVV